MSRGWHVSFLLGVALLVPTSLQAQSAQQTGKIIGLVRVVRGDFPPNPVLITLEARGAPVESLYADNQGRFAFSNLLGNHYSVSVNDDSYEPILVTVDVNPDFIATSFVQLTLVPRESKKKSDPLDKKVAGGNPYLVDPAEYYRHFPKKTVKEFEKGVEAEKARKLDEAIAHYQKALRTSPDFYPAHNNLGSAFLSRQQFVEAQNQFQAAIKGNQNDPEAHFNLANVLLLTQHFDEATIEIQEGMKRQPNSAFGQFLQGTLYVRTARPELAEKSLQSALNLDPKMSQAYLQLVNLYIQQQRTPDAINELEAFLKLFPDGPFSPKARDLLQRLQAEASAKR